MTAHEAVFSDDAWWDSQSVAFGSTREAVTSFVDGSTMLLCDSY